MPAIELALGQATMAFVAIVVLVVGLSHVIGLVALSMAFVALREIHALRYEQGKMWARLYSERAASLAVTTSMVGGAGSSAQRGSASVGESVAVGGDSGDVRA